MSTTASTSTAHATIETGAIDNNAVENGVPGEPMFVVLDPKVLAGHPANIRTDLGDLTELANSIRSLGVLEPIVIVPITDTDADTGGDDNSGDQKDPPAGGFRIVAGHRRVAAAISAKQTSVPCVIRRDLAGDVEAISGMIAENVLRANLSPTEEAAAYAQLAAFDLSPAQIAKRTGRTTKTVKDALKLHVLPEPIKERVATQTLTLDDAAAIAEFASDEKAHARLLKAADTGYGLAYAVAEERRRRDKKQRAEASRAALKKDGVTVVGEPKGWPYYSEEARVVDLAPASTDHSPADDTAGAGEPTAFTPEAHATCPGHAAFLDKDGQPVFICRNPEAHAHLRLRRTNFVTPEEAARRQAEDDARQQRAEALEVAASVRREFLRTLLASPKAPIALHRAGLLILFGFTLDADREHPQRVTDLLTITTGSGATDTSTSECGPDIEVDAPSLGEAYRTRLDATPENRLWQHPLAHAAALAEANLDRAASGRPWGYRRSLTILWLDLLASLGHQISPIEQTLIDEASTPEPEDDLGEEDDLGDDSAESGGVASL